MKIIKYSLIALVVLAILAVSFNKAGANPSAFLSPVQTSSATSSQTTLGPSQSTTLTIDSFASGVTKALEYANLQIQVTAASTTASNVTIAFSYSHDGNDWYGDTSYIQASTTAISNIGSNRTYSWTPGTLATSSKLIVAETPARFIRATVTANTATSSVWGQFIGVRESN